MDPDQLVACGQLILEFVANYWRTIEERCVVPNVQPGYLRDLLPIEAPEEPDTFPTIVNDLESSIMSGVTNWHSPNFHAYFPTSNSYAGVCGDILSSGIGKSFEYFLNIKFSWKTVEARDF